MLIMRTTDCIFPVMKGTGLLMAAWLFGVLMPHRASAECVSIADDLGSILPYADAVFSGTATDVTDLSGALDRFVTLDVDRVWKGPVTKRFSIHTFDLTADRYSFDVGRKYLVFAHSPRTEDERVLLRALPSEREPFIVGICGSGTRWFSEVQSKVSERGPGQRPR